MFMALSPVSGMKMKNLLVGVVLGILAAVHPTPVNTVAKFPTEAEGDVRHENVKFLPLTTKEDIIQEIFPDSLILYVTTKSPKRNTTIQASKQLSFNSKETDTIDGSPVVKNIDISMTSVFLQPSGDHYVTTSETVSHSQSSTSTMLLRDTEDSRSDSFTTKSLQSGFVTSSLPNKIQSHVTPDHMSVSQTTDPALSSSNFLSTFSSGLESRDGEILNQYDTISSSMTSSPRTETSTAPSTSTAPPTVAGTEGSDSGSGMSGLPRDSFEFLDTFSSGLGSGDREILNQYASTSSSMTSSPRTETSTALSTSTAPPTVAGTEGSDSGSGMPGLPRNSFEFLDTFSSGLGSGDGEMLDQYPATPSNITSRPRTETSTTLSTASMSLVGERFVDQSLNPPSPQNKENRTPGWMIILACIVGVAALAIICVAIATRDKWQGPSQVSQLETKTNSSDQQKALEVETFLQKDERRENRKAPEYTIIPLDELPESY